MKTIYKYPLPFKDHSSILLPFGAEILDIKIQDKKLYMWALVNTNEPTVERFFEMFSTGEEIHYDMGVDRKYIATIHDSPYVWHIFERIN